jgi:hypothetical protein
VILLALVASTTAAPQVNLALLLPVIRIDSLRYPNCASATCTSTPSANPGTYCRASSAAKKQRPIPSHPRPSSRCTPRMKGGTVVVRSFRKTTSSRLGTVVKSEYLNLLFAPSLTLLLVWLKPWCL